MALVGFTGVHHLQGPYLALFRRVVAQATQANRDIAVECPKSSDPKDHAPAMISAIAASGDGGGLIAFVCGGPGQAPEPWATIRLAYDEGLPVVVFGCGCSVRCFPSLGDGHWTTAGAGVWSRGWRWEEDVISLGRAIRETVFDLLHWTPIRCGRRRVELDFPLMLNLGRWLRQGGREEQPDPRGGAPCSVSTADAGGGS